MSNFVRREDLENQVRDAYDIDVGVYFRSINKDSYEVKLVKDFKEVIVREHMKKGLTERAVTEFGGTITLFDEYCKAEQSAIEILRG